MSSFWQRRRNAETRLTIEGWVYLVFLAFITIGSILRNVNLLVLMAGLMYAPLILHWRSCNRLLRNLRAKRNVPQRIHAKEPVKLTWTVHNESDQATAWNILISDQLVYDESEDPGVEKKSLTQRVKSTLVREEETFEQTLWRLLLQFWNWVSAPESWRGDSSSLMMIDHVEGGNSRTGLWQVTFPQRGRYFVGPAKLTATSPLGLQACILKFPKIKPCYVAPALGRLSQGWVQHMQSVRFGDESGKRRLGMDQEKFYALRPWRSGDSRKHIHWRTTARYAQPIVRQFDQNVDQDVAIVLDLYCPSQDGTHDKNQVAKCNLNVERALSFAATVISQTQNDVRGRITLGVCGQRKNFFPGRQPDFVASAMKSLAVAQSAPFPLTAEALLETANVVGAGTPIFVISTRPEPDLLLLMPRGHDTDQKLQEVSHNLYAKRLQRIKAGVNWVRIDGERFQSLFSTDSGSMKSSPQDAFTTPSSAREMVT